MDSIQLLFTACIGALLTWLIEVTRRAGRVVADADAARRDARADHALRESEERMRSIVETALDGVISMDHEGRLAPIVWGLPPGQLETLRQGSLPEVVTWRRSAAIAGTVGPAACRLS